MTPSSIYLYSDRVWLDQQLVPASIAIEDGQIVAITAGQKIANAIDYSDNIIMPGVIDAHVHINEPGRTEWEGFDTATKAAARGGTTTLVDMPLNSSPVVTSVAALQQKVLAAKGKLHVNCGFWAGAVDANIDRVEALLSEGCLGVKVFLSNSGLEEFPKISLEDLEVLMQHLARFNKPFLAHCELDTLPADHRLQEQPRHYPAYLGSRPKAWENEAVKAFITLCEKHQCRAHIVHLASDEIVPWLIEKRKAGVPFTVETCPHYLFFQAEDIPDGATLYKCAPPIRNTDNRRGLIKAIKEGLIDFIATDHSPAPPEYKALDSGDFSKAWGGIAGLQFLLPASWTALKDDLSLEAFIPLLTSRPAQFLGLDNRLGEIAVGYDADLCIWNPEQSFTVTEAIIEHRHKASPYLGHELWGTVNHSYVNGRLVYEQDHFVQLNRGKRIKENLKK